MSDAALPTSQHLDDRPKRLEVRGKVRQALDVMVWEGLTWDDAARSVGFTVASMRKALQRPHVLAYLKAEREVLRASASPRNIHRLIEIREKADNMPAIQAIRTLEQLGDVDGAGASVARAAPGLVIVIQSGAAHAPQAPNTVQVIDNADGDE